MKRTPNAIQAGHQEGDARKRDAFALLEARRQVFVCRARRALLTYALTADTVSADDVAELVGPTPGIDPRYLGTVPAPLARAGIITHVGYERSCRPGRHACIISTWEIADRAAAVAWLDAHPDLPDPDDDGGAPPASPSPKSPATHQTVLF